MAYITKEEVQKIRTEIKNSFPNTFKFSVTREHASSINVTLLQSPLNFISKSKTNTRQLNCFNHKLIFRLLNDIINRKNYDHSDTMTDYFDVGYYSNISLGNYDKPYKQISK